MLHDSLSLCVHAACAGAPLSESDLTPNEELGHEIKRWIIMRSTTAANSTVSSSTPESAAVATSGPANDDLYDF